MDRPFTRITETIIEHLRRNGYDAQYGNLSETEHGVSEYVVVWQDSKCQKIRISDHSVESRQRMSDEILISINTDENEAAVQCLHEIRIRYDFDKYFERKRVKVESLSSFETPYPMPDDEILSSRPRKGKKGRPETNPMIFMVRRKKVRFDEVIVNRASGEVIKDR